jgi:hypothetical protein
MTPTLTLAAIHHSLRPYQEATGRGGDQPVATR